MATRRNHVHARSSAPPFTRTLPADIEPQQSVTLDPRTLTRRPRSGIDCGRKGSHPHTPTNAFRRKAIRERLDPTLITAISERDKCALKAKMMGYAGNWAASPSGVLDDGWSLN
ncbi:hypothetical protein K443DRAFT_8836 [Laccaria amethystina LaAM-08-1]|uniref:Uncharacterized protein n=1 Tax=Laccaria amethystina LaAM-08-1 TaxID=1095629 RepID=A0A0C9XSJ9_9AGAR|nr:hypothetical protein K443DRAFT_8836 [Laccaria amethystina LaAM-08-1]